MLHATQIAAAGKLGPRAILRWWGAMHHQPVRATGFVTWGALSNHQKNSNFGFVFCVEHDDCTPRRCYPSLSMPPHPLPRGIYSNDHR